MSALEREIIEKFHQLDDEAKLRVLEKIQQDAPQGFDYETWWKQVEALQSSIRARIGDQPANVLSLLEELREEKS